ncbi:MAG TPA: citrate/2-methylcitrate synthase [Thermoplasmata archaeon]|nr:citrate/2-methylcitrate synthase [Thermoplasmata archaeon]
MSTPIRVPKGLEHVILGDSAISLVEGETGGLAYRGFAVQELAGRASYEAVVHLLTTGEPPAEPVPRGVAEELRRSSPLPRSVEAVADALPPELPALEALRTLLSALGDGAHPYPPTLSQGFELIARTPVMLARHVRRSGHLPAIAPRADLGHVANYLWMLTGTEPDRDHVRALEQYFVLLADHGMNASTFAVRIVLSTQSDLFSAATAGLAALKGPAHGGAPSKVSEMLDSVGRAESARRWIVERLERRERLYGFGHRAYKTEDPRAVLLHAVARTVADPDRLRLAEEVEAVALEELQRRRPGQRLYTNVEYYSAVVLEAVGLSPALFTPTFAVARTAGWAAHALEQAADNRLIRPDIHYTGPAVGRRWPEAARLPA